MAENIVKTAIARGSKDNIAVVVMKLNGATGSTY